MADILDFKIPRDPELAEFVMHILSFVQEQCQLNDMMRRELLVVHNTLEVQKRQISKLQKQVFDIRHKGDE